MMTAYVIAIDSAPRVDGPPQGQWTYEDWEKLDHSLHRYEVIHRALYVTTAPGPLHQWAVQQLYELLGVPGRQQGIGYAYLAPIGVVMPGCDPVQPDFVFIRKIRAAMHIKGVPDLIVEALCPKTAAYGEGVKKDAYAKAGVPEYAVIDLRERVLRYYRLGVAEEYAAPREVREGDTIRFDCAPSIEVPIAELFAGAPDSTL